MSDLEKLHQLTKKVFNNEFKGQKTEIGMYSKELYKRILKISKEIMQLLDENRYTSIPILMRTMIEGIVDISNINDYGQDYIKYLKLMQLVKKYEFYQNNYDDYCYITDNNDILDIDKIKKKIVEEEKKILAEFSNNDINKKLKSYINECVEIGGIEKINYKELKRYLTINHKLELLLNHNSRKRNVKYKTWFYIMSQYTHNSIEFIEEYSEKSDIEDYKDLIASILKNGLIYISAILDIRIHDDKFKEIRVLKKKVSAKSKQVNVWKKFNFEYY